MALGDKQKKVTYDGWPGGLFSVANARDCLKEQLLKADNVVFDEFGKVKPRPGLLAYGNYTAAAIIGIMGPISSAAGFRYLSLSNKTLVQDAPLAVINTYANGGRGQFIYFGGQYAHTNGVDAMQAWVSGAVATANALGAPLSRILHVHNDRVFCANGNTLYETAPGTGPNTGVDNFATGATWAINPGDGDPIRGLASIDRDLYIFKEKSIWRQTGYTVNERQTRVFDGKRGTIAPDSIQTVDLKGGGRAIVFLGSDNRLYAIIGGQVQEIGEAVQNHLSTIYKGSVTDDTTPLNYNKHRCVSAVHPDGYYLLGFATVNGSSPAQFTGCLVLHLNLPYESQKGLRWAFAYWYDTLEGPAFDIRFGAMAYFDDLVRKTVAIGQTTMVGGTFELFVLESPAIDYDSDPYSAGGPFTYPIPDTIRTRDEEAGSDDTYKGWFEVTAYISKSTVGSIAYTLSQINDSDSTVISSESRSASAATANKVYPCTGYLTNDATRCSIVVRQWAGVGQTLQSLELKYIPGAPV
jgi:hypothetical protein